MRKSVLLVCTISLLSSLLILLMASRSPEHSSEKLRDVQLVSAASALADQTSPVRVDGSRKNYSTSMIETVVPDSEELIRQIKVALDSDNPSDQEMMFTNQLPALIKADPWSAACFAASLPDGLTRVDFMRVVVQNWSQTNPADAAKWISQLKDSNERDTMLSCLCFREVQTDPLTAIQTLVQQNVDDERKKIILNNLVQEWATTDLENVMAWAQDYNEVDRDDLFAQIALSESKIDPVEAARIVVQRISPGKIQEETVLSVIKQWALVDSSGVASWVNDFPAGDLRDKANSEISQIVAYQAAR